MKAESAAVFREVLERAKADPEYLRLKAIHRERYDPLKRSPRGKKSQ